MYLMFYINENGSKVYTMKGWSVWSPWLAEGGSRVCTMKKEAPDGSPTLCAHPARFSPDDKFSKQRIICKRRFGLLPTQSPPFTY